MGLERDLHELLFCHDCVIVPQWGGFLTHYRSARLDEARKLVHPPAKDLSFNRHLVRNDGLLADHLAKREGIGFDVATARIDAEVAEWRTKLDKSGRLELPQIGIFYRDAEHNLQFDPDKKANYLKDAFGLRPVAAVPVERAQPTPIVRKVEPEVLPEVTITRRAPLYWAAAAAAVVLLGASAFWAYQLGGQGNAQWSGFTFFDKAPARSYTPLTRSELEPVTSTKGVEIPAGTGIVSVPLSVNDSVSLLVDLGAPMVEVAVADSTAVVVKPVAAESTGRFHVVGGCFAQPENADKLLEELLAEGYPARRLAKRGQLYPVVYGSYDTREDALRAMGSVRGKGARSAWLLVR